MMKVYKLIGKHCSGEDWDYNHVYDSYEKAEQARQRELTAYTYQGACSWVFEIQELEVR